MRLLKDEHKRETMALKAQIKSLSSQSSQTSHSSQNSETDAKDKLEAEYQRGKNEVIEVCKTKIETMKSKASIKYEEMKKEVDTVKQEKEQLTLKLQKFVQQVRERDAQREKDEKEKEKENTNKEEQVKGLLKDLYRVFKDQVQESNQYSGTDVLVLVRKVLQEEAAKKK